jgi:hypothetical protein
LSFGFGGGATRLGMALTRSIWSRTLNDCFITSDRPPRCSSSPRFGAAQNWPSVFWTKSFYRYRCLLAYIPD